MAKITLPRMAAGFLSAETYNSAMTQLEAFIDSLLSRDGALPNHMEADIDMDGHTLLNLGASGDLAGLVTVEQMEDYVATQSAGIVVQKTEIQTATGGQVTFDLNTFTYAPGSNNLAVYVNGVRIFTPAQYTESSSTRVTLTTPSVLNDKVAFVSNEFLATVELPLHEHTWDQVTGKPETATRNPTYAEVTDKPASFTPSAHVHSAVDITSGRLADARRGVYVQATQPVANSVGELWFW